jgi:hypothetical protein
MHVHLPSPASIRVYKTSRALHSPNLPAIVKPGRGACWPSADPVLRATTEIEACLQTAPLNIDPIVASSLLQKISDLPPQYCAANISFLLELYNPRHAGLLIQHEPRALSLPLKDWFQFLHGFGVNEREFWEAVRCAGAVADSVRRAGSPRSRASGHP